MIKKTTLFLLLGAVILGAAVYYFDWRRSQKESENAPADAAKLAFSIQPQDVTSLVIKHPANPAEPSLQFEKRDEVWRITQPLEARADQPSLDGIIDGLSSARIAQTEPGAPDRLKVYGLDPPAVSLEFQLRSGAKHTVALGKKDFSGISVYAIVDGAKDVALLPESLLVTSGKSLQDLRDRGVLHIAADKVASFDLKNSSRQLSAKKEKDQWVFTKPAGSRGDAGNIGALLTSLGSAKWTKVASESPDNLAKYGLANPALTFTAVDDKGQSATLIVGKKEGDQYFARDTSAPMIFLINEELYKKLAENYSDLRDKKLAHFDPAEINHVEIHNANGTIICTRKSEFEWTLEEPAELKGKPADISKLFTPLEQATAGEIFDQPAPNIRAILAKPEFEAVLTDKSGKKVTVQISKESNGSVYGQTSESPAVYELDKQILSDLNFKPSDMALSASPN
ncbi:MAG: DUF4340 domain-containing protein [Candidatus Acidiferrales bacterium]|jgi:hypothetical protein